jgi:hypothetical protein
MLNVFCRNSREIEDNSWRAGGEFKNKKINGRSFVIINCYLDQKITFKLNFSLY